MTTVRLYNMSIILWILLAGTIIFMLISGALYAENKEEIGFAFSVIAVILGILFVVGLIRSEEKSLPPPPITPKESKPKPVSIPKRAYDIPLEIGAYDLPTLETSYRHMQAVYNKQLTDFNKAGQQVAKLENSIPLTKETLSDYKAIMDNALAKLKKAQERV